MIAGLVDGIGAMLSQDFMQRALLAGTVTAIAAGALGYFVVLRNQVFAAESLGHVAFTGALAALAVGLPASAGLLVVTPGVAVGMGALGGRLRTRDIVVGTVFAWILGLGVLCLSLYTTSRSTGNGAVGINVLFGSILGLSLSQAVYAALIGGGVTLSLLAVARPLLFASVDPDVAAARGVPLRLLGMVFMALLGVTAAEAVQAVGALLLLSLLVTPAAAAYRMTATPVIALGISVGLGVTCVWLGLALSNWLGTIPPSCLIVGVAAVGYAASLVIGRFTPAVPRGPRLPDADGMIAP